VPPSFKVYLSIWFAEVDVVSVSVVEGQNLRYCGIGAGYDDVIIDGNLDELKVCVDLLYELRAVAG